MTTKELNKLTKSELIKLAINLNKSLEQRKKEYDSLEHHNTEISKGYHRAKEDVKWYMALVDVQTNKIDKLTANQKPCHYENDMNRLKNLQEEVENLRVIKNLASALVDKI